MRHEFNDEIDRKLKPAQKVWAKPQLKKIELTPEEIAGIVGAANPSQALRDFGRANASRFTAK